MKIIEGSSFQDNRRIISFVNDFDLKNIRSMCVLKPETDVFRAWQGHKIESMWFSYGQVLFKFKQ